MADSTPCSTCSGIGRVWHDERAMSLTCPACLGACSAPPLEMQP